MKMLYNAFVVLALIASGGALYAQSAVHHFSFPKKAQVVNRDITWSYYPRLLSLEMPSPGSGSYRAFLQERKTWIEENFTPAPGASGMAVMGAANKPLLGMNFEGNAYDFSVPNDNDACISDSGTVVSVINSTAHYYDAAGTHLGGIALDSWSDSLGLDMEAFDPKTVYDPNTDKFVVVYLNGFTDSTSNIVVAFSETNDPMGAWNLYALPGNPLNDTSWTDYPIIAITEKELFITVNLLINDEPWQTAFKQSIVWQINLNDGYTGDSLSTALWTGISYGGRNIRNLCPIKGADGPTGPDMWLLSNRNFAVTSDSIFIVHITDTIGAAGALVTTDLKLTSTPYGLAPDARQKYGTKFATNDSRILGGFLLDGDIQFVSNTINPASGYPGIYHGFVTDVAGTPAVTGYIIHDSTVDLGYPNISWSGLASGDASSIISFDHTNTDTAGGISAVYYDGAGNYSDRLTVKKGLSYINILSGPLERWGDYSGSQRKYNEPGKVWIAGLFGKMPNRLGTWIAELGTPPPVAVEEPAPQGTQITAWPVPAQERVNLSFELDVPAFIDIGLYDATGKRIETFYRDRAKSGLNDFSFDTQPLSTGVYFIRILSGSEIIASKSIVKQ